jgi:hypothetical protein
MVAWHEVPGKCGHTDPSQRVRYDELPCGPPLPIGWFTVWKIWGSSSDATSGDAAHIRRGGDGSLSGGSQALRARLPSFSPSGTKAPSASPSHTKPARTLTAHCLLLVLEDSVWDFFRIETCRVATTDRSLAGTAWKCVRNGDPSRRVRYDLVALA